VQAAVNANAFAGLPDASGNRDSNWHATQPVDIAGLAVHAGVYRSKYDNATVTDVCFGITTDGRPYIGAASKAPPLREAVNGWSLPLLVENGISLPKAGGPRHPRTAIGLNRTGRWLYLVVVDGRQPGYSNGVTGRELADVMVRIGSDRAVNVDGGGSSILLVEQSDGQLATINRPSGASPRPVPVLLAITKKH
jgi:exopolysaccharide biosynthesis protein